MAQIDLLLEEAAFGVVFAGPITVKSFRRLTINAASLASLNRSLLGIESRWPTELLVGALWGLQDGPEDQVVAFFVAP